jgi:hypothetical protein
LGQDLVRDAHRERSLWHDFTDDDLFGLAGTAKRESAAPAGWRRVLERALAWAWI